MWGGECINNSGYRAVSSSQIDMCGSESTSFGCKYKQWCLLWRCCRPAACFTRASQACFQNTQQSRYFPGADLCRESCPSQQAWQLVGGTQAVVLSISSRPQALSIRTHTCQRGRDQSPVRSGRAGKEQERVHSLFSQSGRVLVRKKNTHTHLAK